jgi:hypothetical protein
MTNSFAHNHLFRFLAEVRPTPLYIYKLLDYLERRRLVVVVVDDDDDDVKWKKTTKMEKN